MSLVNIDVAALFGLGPVRWTLPLRPGSGEALKAWLAALAVDNRARALSPFRTGSGLVRRHDRRGGNYFVLAAPRRTGHEWLYPEIDNDTLRITQVVQPGFRAFVLVVLMACGFVGLGGVILAIVTDQPSALVTLIFPTFARLVVIPNLRGMQRDTATAFFTEQSTRLDLHG